VKLGEERGFDSLYAIFDLLQSFENPMFILVDEHAWIICQRSSVAATFIETGSISSEIGNPTVLWWLRLAHHSAFVRNGANHGPRFHFHSSTAVAR
jgi:hypothetical protein